MEGTPEEAEKTWVWPDLVYTELLAMVIGMIVLVVWSLVLKAPIEEPANPARTPNPSKAPWYFLGLQEMLVYFDPWLAGVVFPSLIIVGLMAIPFIDTNPRGQRLLHVQGAQGRDHDLPLRLPDPVGQLVMLGTFLRGPNWNFFGPYEYWDVHKLLALNNVNLSEYIWIRDAPLEAAGEHDRARAARDPARPLLYRGAARAPGLPPPDPGAAHRPQEVLRPAGALALRDLRDAAARA